MRETHMQVARHHGRAFAISALAAIAAMTAATIGSAAAHVDKGVSTTLVEPSTTGAGITAETDSARYHVVVTPNHRRGAQLVVMLPGSNVGAAGYSDFTTHAAELGYAAISLTYPNRGTIGAACQAADAGDSCFAQARGEIVFGAGVPDPKGVSYSSDKVSVDAANSIVGRLIAVIDHLAADDPFWNKFLIHDKKSPYTAAHRGHVRLNYKLLILAGHSQGGGHAAFLAMRTKVHRVVMLSSPDDTNVASGTAQWITGDSATRLDHYWGLRHEGEGPYGQHVAQVWDVLGGDGVGAGDNTSEVDVGDGSGDPKGSHRLVLPGDLGTPLANHASTAYDGYYLAGVPEAWTYMLTGGGDSGPGNGPSASHGQDLQVTVPEAAPGKSVWSIDDSFTPGQRP